MRKLIIRFLRDILYKLERAEQSKQMAEHIRQLVMKAK